MARVRRKRLRLRGFDYATVGFYLVTVCTHQRRCVLGRIETDMTILSAFGEIVSGQIANLAGRFAGVSVDTFVVMPNHVHVLVGLEACAEAHAAR